MNIVDITLTDVQKIINQLIKQTKQKVHFNDDKKYPTPTHR